MRKFFRLCAVLLTLSVALSPAHAANTPTAKDAVFDVPALLSTPLNPRVLKSTEKAGIVTEEEMAAARLEISNARLGIKTPRPTKTPRQRRKKRRS